MSQIGAAYIEIKADLARFPASFRRQLKEALREGLAGFRFDELDAEAERAGREAAGDMADGFRQERDRIAEEGRDSGHGFAAGFREAVVRSLGHLNLGGILPGGGGGGGGGGGNDGFVAELRNGFQEIAQLLEDVLQGSVDLLGMLQSGFSSIFAGRGEQLSEFFSRQLERVRELWTRLREGGREMLGRLFSEDSREWFRNLMTRGRTWLSDLGTRARSFWTSFSTHSRSFFTNLANRGRRFFSDWADTSGHTFWSRMGNRTRSWWARTRTQIVDFASRVGTQISSTLSRAFSSIGPQLQEAFGKIGGALGPIGGAIAPIAGTAVMVPVFLLLAGAATQAAAAILAVPAAIGVLLVAIAPLMIAMSGFTEAVGAGLSGDTEKFGEALKGLAPSARSVAKELVALGPQFKSIKANVQENFFRPMVGVLKPLGEIILPLVNRGLSQVAFSLGELFTSLFAILSEQRNLDTFMALFATANRVVMTLEPAVANLAQALLNLIRPALPFIEKGATAFRDFAAGVEAFTSRISGDGTLVSWFARAGHIIKTATGIAKEFGAYLLTMLGGKVGDAGSGFLDDILSTVKDINAFMQTRDGQEFINNLATGLKGFGKVLVWVLSLLPYLMQVVNGTVLAVRLLGRALEAIGRGAVDGVMWLGKFFSDLWESITEGLSTAWSAVSNFFTGIGSAIADFFTKTIPSWFDAFVSFFRELPDRATEAGSGLADKLKGWAIASSKAILDGFLFGIGVVIGLFLAFPGLVVRAIQALPGLLASIWDEIWAYAVSVWTSGRDLVVAGVMAIPGLLAAAGTAILSFFTWLWDQVVAGVTAVPGMLAEAGAAIGSFFSDLWNGVVTDSYEAVVSGFNSVVDWLTKIPGRIAGLGPAVLEAARGIGRNIARGLTEIGNFATDLGAKVTSALKGGINYAIRGINAGIAAVDDKIPGSLPRIPELARGAVVDSPTIALIGEAGSEVVIPLTNRARAQDLAEQSGLLSMLRGAGGGTHVNVVAYLDPSGVIIPVVRTVVDQSLDGQGAELPYARAA